MNRESDHPCGTLLGTRLVIDGRTMDGSYRWRKIPHTCGKPANVEGPDGVMRCAAHDRKARGLSAKWKKEGPSAVETAVEPEPADPSEPIFLSESGGDERIRTAE